jgi:AhpD family alkylhydroperoxidase
MPRVPVHDMDSALKASRDLLTALKERYGKVLNIYGEMAHAPVVPAAYSGIQAAIAEHGSFDARTREAIALAVAEADGCGYCRAAHTARGQRAGLSRDDTSRPGSASRSTGNSHCWPSPARPSPTSGRSTRRPGSPPSTPAGVSNNSRNCSPT